MTKPERADPKTVFGMTHNPFSRGVPCAHLWTPPGFDAFVYRVESIVLDGGFALLSGDPGLGKSKALQLIGERLNRVDGNIVVGAMERPQGSLSDSYRELGDIFAVSLSPSNRYGGFKNLRTKWREHIQTMAMRPILLIDEAQELSEICLTELRILSSARFDSEALLTVVICGDARLTERLRRPALISVGSRIRARWTLQAWPRNDLTSFLDHALEVAGVRHLMTDDLKRTLIESCSGNLRILCSMADELLDIGALKNVAQLDEQLYPQRFATPSRREKRART